MKKQCGKKRISAVLGCILLTVLLLAAMAGCAEKESAEVPQETYAAVEIPAASEEETAAVEETEEMIPDVTVDTPYCTLRIPGEWKDRILVEQYEFDVGMSVIFFGKIHDMQIELYSLHFGGDEGIPVGSVMSKKGYMMDVTAQLAEFIADESWDAKDADEISAMQETMNYVIERLREEPEIITAE